MRTLACVAACLLWSVRRTGGAREIRGHLGSRSRRQGFPGAEDPARGKRSPGTLNAGSIHLNDEGELIEATPVEDREAPFFFAKAEGDKLEFDYQDQGDNEIMHFELKLTGDGAGELRIVDEHIPKMKPFRLRKK